jgi:hypothetical protein
MRCLILQKFEPEERCLCYAAQCARAILLESFLIGAQQPCVGSLKLKSARSLCESEKSARRYHLEVSVSSLKR